MKLAVLLGTIIVLVVVYFLEGRSRYWSGILATAPLKTLSVILMVWASSHDPKETALVANAMVVGVAATVCFLIVTSAALLKTGSLPYAMGLGLVAWVGFAVMLERMT